MCVDVCLLEAIVPGRIAAGILNVTRGKGGDKQMKAIAGSAVARLRGWGGCTGSEWERLLYSHVL